MPRPSPSLKAKARSAAKFVGDAGEALNSGLNKKLGGVGAGAVMGAMSGGEEPTYYDSAKGVKITKDRAIQELAKHGHDAASPEYSDFFKEMGDKSHYAAQKVLDWLGY